MTIKYHNEEFSFELKESDELGIKGYLKPVLLSQANIMALGVFLDIHESYWPIYTKNWRQDGIPQHEAYLYKLKMEPEVAKTVHDYCK